MQLRECTELLSLKISEVAWHVKPIWYFITANPNALKPRI